jgi:hypothetical protein
VRQAAQHGHVVHGQVVGGGFVLAQPGQVRARSRRASVQVAPVQQHLPAATGSRPASTRSSVDLPAPLGPTMLVQRPAASAR